MAKQVIPGTQPIPTAANSGTNIAYVNTQAPIVDPATGTPTASFQHLLAQQIIPALKNATGVTSFSYEPTNGINGQATTTNGTVSLELSLGDITPSSIDCSGTITANEFVGNGQGLTDIPITAIDGLEIERNVYTGTFGDGVTTLYTINHNLNSDNILYSLYQLSGLSWIAVDASVTIVDVNDLTVNFNAPPAVNSISIIVVTTTAILSSVNMGSGSGTGSDLPPQTNCGGYFLDTNGTQPGWSPVSQVPSVIGYSNAVLSTDGNTYYWASGIAAGSVINGILQAAGLQVPALVTSLPSLPNSLYPNGAQVFLTTSTPPVGYTSTNNSGSWSWQLTIQPVTTATITSTLAASGIHVPTYVSSLPGLPNAAYPINSTVVLAGNSQQYVNVGNVWTAPVINGSQMTGTIPGTLIDSISGSQITGVNANVITGTLDATKVNAGNLAVNAAYVTGTLNAGLVSAGALAVNAAYVTGTLNAACIAAGSLTVGQINSSTIQTACLAAGVIGAAVISAGIISVSNLQAGTMSASSYIKTNNYTPATSNGGVPIGVGIFSTPISSIDVNGISFPTGAIAEFGGNVNLNGYQLSNLGVSRLYYANGGYNASFLPTSKGSAGQDYWQWYAPLMGAPGTQYRIRVTLTGGGGGGNALVAGTYGAGAGGSVQFIITVRDGNLLNGYVGWGGAGYSNAGSTWLQLGNGNTVLPSGTTAGVWATANGGSTGGSGGVTFGAAQPWCMNMGVAGSGGGAAAVTIWGVNPVFVCSGAGGGRSGSQNAGSCQNWNQTDTSAGGASIYGVGGNSGTPNAPATNYGAGGGLGGGAGAGGAVTIEIL